MLIMNNQWIIILMIVPVDESEHDNADYKKYSYNHDDSYIKQIASNKIIQIDNTKYSKVLELSTEKVCATMMKRLATYVINKTYIEYSPTNSIITKYYKLCNFITTRCILKNCWTTSIKSFLNEMNAIKPPIKRGQSLTFLEHIFGIDNTEYIFISENKYINNVHLIGSDDGTTRKAV